MRGLWRNFWLRGVVTLLMVMLVYQLAFLIATTFLNETVGFGNITLLIVSGSAMSFGMGVPIWIYLEIWNRWAGKIMPAKLVLMFIVIFSATYFTLSLLVELTSAAIYIEAINEVAGFVLLSVGGLFLASVIIRPLFKKWHQRQGEVSLQEHF